MCYTDRVMLVGSKMCARVEFLYFMSSASEAFHLHFDRPAIAKDKIGSERFFAFPDISYSYPNTSFCYPACSGV